MSITAEAYRNIGTTEHRLQVLVLAHLAIAAKPGVRWHATPNAARRTLRMGQRMKAEGLVAGVADLCIRLPQGRAAWLEMKTTKGRQSLPQKVFEAECKALGHPYAVAHTLDEAIEFLEQVGALR